MTSHCKKGHAALRVAQSQSSIALFAPDKPAVSRVTHALSHAYTHAVNDRTDMPRRGQLEPAAQAALELLRNPAGGGFKTPTTFNFVSMLMYPLGAAPPGPKGQRGHLLDVAALPPLTYEQLNT